VGPRDLRHEGGIAAAVYASEALRRAGIVLPGAIEISGTVTLERAAELGKTG